MKQFRFGCPKCHKHFVSRTQLFLHWLGKVHPLRRMSDGTFIWVGYQKKGEGQ